MNKILIAAVALATLGAAGAQAAGRDGTLYTRVTAPQAQPAQPQAQRNVVEGRNATVTLPTVSDAYINQAVDANARSTH